MNQDLYLIYKEKFENVFASSPFCFGTMAGAAQEAVNQLAKEGYDSKELDECYEHHRSQHKRLWNYTGD